MILENSALTLIRLEVPGGGLNEVPREACDPRELCTVGELPGGGPRELRAVHRAQQVLVCPKR
jgi:hypothetical protein